jgi:hypothetical protein
VYLTCLILSHSPYLGGAGLEFVSDLTVDRSGSAYIPGETTSEDVPVTPRAFQTTYGGGDSDGYVTKLNPAGTRAVYSTYLGGSNVDGPGRSVSTARASPTSRGSPAPATSR